MDILAAIDFSNGTDKLISTISALSKAHKAKVWLIHVADVEPPGGFDVYSTTLRDGVAEAYHEQHKTLQGYAQSLRDSGIDANALLIQGAVAETILRQAKKLDVGAIIMGSHGHGALYHLLLGSASTEVLEKSDCPVVIVPTREAWQSRAQILEPTSQR